MSEHKAQRPRKRGRKIAAGVAALVLVPVAAWAAWTYLAGIGGSVAVKGGTLSVSSVAKAGGTASTCAPTNSGGTVTVNMAGYPGDTCQVQLTYSAPSSNSDTLVATGAKWDTAAKVTAKLVNGTCGAKVAPGSSGGGLVVVELTISATATPGQSIAAESGVSGVTWQPDTGQAVTC